MGTNRGGEFEGPAELDDRSFLESVGGGQTHEQDDTGYDDGQTGSGEEVLEGDTGTGDETQGEAAGDDDYTPPTREEWEAMQQQIALLGGLADEQLDALLTGQQPDAAAGAEAGTTTAPTEADIAAMLTPKTFAPAPELLQKVLVDGDSAALNQMFTEFAGVLQHNNRIEMNQAVMHGLTYALPVHRAADKFYDRNPELLGARELVENHMWQVRNQHPQANDMQILRMVEKKLAPVIARAKKIAGERTANQTKTNLTPAPAGGGQTPSPRGRTAGQSPKTPSTAERIEQLEQYAAGERY